MRRSQVGFLAVAFVFCVAGVSMAGGMMDTLKGAAEETKKEAQGTMEREKQAVEPGKAIEAKEATQQEMGSMMDQVKGEAKKKTNEMIDNIGK